LKKKINGFQNLKFLENMKKKYKKIGIIDCGFGNIASLINAIKYLNCEYVIIKKPENLTNLTHLILPGVGSFNLSAKKLRNLGWINGIKDFIKFSKPFMGICLGMQLMFEDGSEHGHEKGLGLFQGRCELFSKNLNIKLPHMGFNLVNNFPSKIWQNIPKNSPFYFVHSYRVTDNDFKNSKDIKISKTFYGEKFISFIEKDKIFGAQFHPEKSHNVGLKLIENFLDVI
tara:strand:+ start:7185 stop:7868 length:684 start_codon:yes stop_codon:yes gene_type:complete